MDRLALVTLAATLAAAFGCRRILPAIGEVVSSHATDGFSGFDYVYRITCTVKNKGGDGTILVTARAAQWSETKPVYMLGGYEQSVDFTFRQASVFDGGFRYECLAR